MLYDFSVYTGTPQEIIEGDLLLSNGSLYLPNGNLQVGNQVKMNFTVNPAGNVTAAGNLTASGTGSFGQVVCSGTGSFGAATVSGAFTAGGGGAFTVNAAGNNSIFTCPMQAPYVNVSNGGLYVYNSGVNTATITAAGALSCTSYGSYCTAPLYTTSFANGTQLDIAWGASTGTSDISHTTNSSSFGFASAGKYLVTVAMMSNTGPSSYVLAISLMKYNGTTYVAQAVQSAYFQTWTGACFTYPVVAISAGDSWKLQLYQNGGTQTYATVCGYAGGGQQGSIPCSYVNFVRIA
jgi:hypothetical protein